MPFGTKVNVQVVERGRRYENGALCGQRLDGSPVLLVTGLITGSLGRGSEKSVF
jgi:hypothetical protein